MSHKNATLAPCILTSSIWTEPSDIRVVWITLLALATKSGKVQISYKKLAEVANVSREVAAQAIEIFSSEDKRSRDTSRAGKRIEILQDGFRILNFDKYNEPLKKVPEKTVGTGISLEYSLVQALKFEWFKEYKTDIHDLRIRRELNELGNESPSDLLKAFKAYIKTTPARFFSWGKFKDIWRSFLVEKKESANEIFERLIKNSTGYSPTAGVFWTEKDVKEKFGAKVAEVFERIGGNAKLKTLNQSNAPFIKKEFVEAYDRQDN